jgi:hypothetical protein
MKYPTPFIIAALFCSTAVTAPEQVTCDSPCDCHDAHGEGRWSVKTDASLPPTDASEIQAVTPSDMFSWPSPDAPITMQSERSGIENKWFALTGRVVELKVEEDGDLHIALHDATGDKPGVVVCEIRAHPQWCEIRTTVFSWTPTRFPFHTGSAKKLTFGQSSIITVTGKAMWDVGHAPKDQRQPSKVHAGLRGVGNSSGDETDIQVIRRQNVACHFAVFFGRLRSTEVEIDCSLQSNSS